MTTKKKLITSEDPKGLDATAKWRAVYNKQKLTDGAQGSAQRLNESKFFWKELGELIQKHTAISLYANEQIASSCAYPKEYKLKPVEEQIKTIAKIFGLDPKEALEFIKALPELPEGAEGWFAIPKVSAIAKNFFPELTNPTEQYCEAVSVVLCKIADSRDFYNHCSYRINEIVPLKFRQSARTTDFMEQFIESKQPGDIVIIAVQYGIKHRGESVCRARETFAGNEFGLGAFALGCMVLVHPNRYVRCEELDTDGAGDEFSPYGDGVFSRAPYFSFGVKLKFGTDDVSSVHGLYGSVSGFVQQS